MRGQIFVVEDDLDVMEFYRVLLQASGYTIWATAVSGEEAIQLYLAEGDHPDAVILDHRLPGCSGLVVARRILQMDPQIPIIFTTADDSVREEATRLGIKHFKRKPINNSRLLNNIAKALAERSFKSDQA